MQFCVCACIVVLVTTGINNICICQYMRANNRGSGIVNTGFFFKGNLTQLRSAGSLWCVWYNRLELVLTPKETARTQRKLLRQSMVCLFRADYRFVKIMFWRVIHPMGPPILVANEREKKKRGLGFKVATWYFWKKMVRFYILLNMLLHVYYCLEASQVFSFYDSHS